MPCTPLPLTSGKDVSVYQDFFAVNEHGLKVPVCYHGTAMRLKEIKSAKGDFTFYQCTRTKTCGYTISEQNAAELIQYVASQYTDPVVRSCFCYQEDKNGSSSTMAMTITKAQQVDGKTVICSSHGKGKNRTGCTSNCEIIERSALGTNFFLNDKHTCALYNEVTTKPDEFMSIVVQMILATKTGDKTQFDKIVNDLESRYEKCAQVHEYKPQRSIKAEPDSGSLVDRLIEKYGKESNTTDSFTKLRETVKAKTMKPKEKRAEKPKREKIVNPEAMAQSAEEVDVDSERE